MSALICRARLDGIVTVVDCKHILQHLDEVKAADVVSEVNHLIEEPHAQSFCYTILRANFQATQQVAFADKMLLNKVDLVTPEEYEEVVERCKVGSLYT